MAQIDMHHKPAMNYPRKMRDEDHH